jgi:hypothetical protein
MLVQVFCVCSMKIPKIHLVDKKITHIHSYRTGRSKSMELERHTTAPNSDRKQRRPDLNRNYHVATSRDEIREFIRRRASRSSEGGSGSPGKVGSSPCRSSPGKVVGVGVGSPCKADPEDMDAWELSMRLDMADIQRKYRQTTFIN